MLLATNFKLVAYFTASFASSIAGTNLPIVDLGYTVQQAFAFNSTGDFYTFRNIRYAAPPVGNLRFRAPNAPAINRNVTNGGASGTECPQAGPGWDTQTGWTSQYLNGQKITLTQAKVNAVNASINATNAPASGVEDCLFLDVFVPEKIFKAAGNSTGSAVMVWIHGGGCTEGSKASSGSPAGLIHRSMTGGQEGIIYVAMNYRLGAFGWLAGPTLQSDGVGNAGLYDQRFALEWVQQYIHLFGGDPSRVTVFGESAGGAGIMHQITAYGGKQGAPFAQAIMQSPGFHPQPDNHSLENQFNEFLSLANVSTLDELRAVSSKNLITANYQQVWHAPYGHFEYGLAVDGIFVPALPGQLLLQGDYVKNVGVMVGHNLDEGLLFTNPLIQTNDEFENVYVRNAIPSANDSVVDYVANTLYPGVFDGTYNYTNQIARQALMTSELSFTCNTYYFDTAYKGIDYAYYFTIYPGLHAYDVPYTYYNGGAGSSKFNTTVALALQDWLVTYAQTGTPSTPDVSGAPKFIMWGANATAEDLNLTTISHVTDPTANQRCAYWQQAFYA